MPLYSWDQAWLQARETSEAALCLLTVTHPSINTIRLVKNTVDITSRSAIYSASYFELDVINDNDQPPRATIALPNVDRAIGIMLMGLVDPPTVKLEVISSAHLDEPIYVADKLFVQNITIDPITISGELIRQNYSSEVCGTIRVTPARCPAIFRRN